MPEQEKEKSIKENRIRQITHLYYSNPDVQKAIFNFSQNREVVPRYFEGFGKRPDSLQYSGDVLAMVKKGATSFHCSEELWQDPLKLSTDLNEKQLNELRTGWDLLIDIDSKYIDYSKISAELIINLLKFHGVKNVGVKFSGSKGLHLIIPQKSFPKEINGVQTKNMFPEWPRIITSYITEKIKPQLIKKITELSKPNKYVRDFQAPKEVMPDIILVSPRHLFRMPYSLHEKTSLASVVLEVKDIPNFQMTDADPLKIKIKNFIPDVKEGEASELLMQALDWDKETYKEESISSGKKFSDFKPIKIEKLSEQNFPPCIRKIALGMSDGRKRGLFVLINFFRSLGIERDEIEKRIELWNAKNEVALKSGYVKSQIEWSFKNKIILPPNCKEYYNGLGVCLPDSFCSTIKNPINYTIRKSFIANKSSASEKRNTTKKTKKFKNSD
jgi:hypothetical protein